MPDVEALLPLLRLLQVVRWSAHAAALRSVVTSLTSRKLVGHDYHPPIARSLLLMAAAATEVVLTAADVEYGIGSQDILTGVSLTIHAGDRVGLVGRNGAGKSTLLKLLIGQMSPTKGSVMPRRDLLMGFCRRLSSWKMSAPSRRISPMASLI